MRVKKTIYKKTGESVDLIRTEEDVANIQRRGYFGKDIPQIGNYSMYLGPSDGGFLVLTPDEVEVVD